MTDQAMDAFEARFGQRVLRLTDPAVARPIDPLTIARTAIATPRPTPLIGQRLDLGWRPSARWAVTAMTAMLIVVVGFAIVGRPTDSGTVPMPSPSHSPSPSPTFGAIPEALAHAWERPYAVEPTIVSDGWYLSLAGGRTGLGPEAGTVTMPFDVALSGPDEVTVTSTVDTDDCAAGTSGTYSWLLQGSDTVLTLTSLTPDACVTRQEALSGMWVRGGIGSGVLAVVEPGTYETDAFDPFGAPGGAGQLRYT
ncbi:MAG: hypothetical protein ACHQ02_08210, partial [Candidatus Limnocylindrales bacterium]